MADPRKVARPAELRRGGRKVPMKAPTEAERRAYRDAIWLIQYRQGWPVERIAATSGVHRMTVYRRLAVAARAAGEVLGLDLSS